MLGDPIRYVWGYESSGDHRLAFEQGETQVDAGPTTNYVSNILPLVEAGLATPLLLYGIPGPDAYERIPYPDLHGAPTVEEAHELLYGEAPSGNAYEALIATLNMLYGANTVALHVDDPPEAHAAVAEAVDCMWEGGFYDDYVEDLSPIGPIADQAVIGPLQDRIASLDPNLRDWIWEFLRETFPGEVPQ